MEMKVYFPGNLRVAAQYKGFTVVTDQPAAAGGDASSPSPFDLFLVSLGTCAGYYMLAFMKQRGIDPAGSGVTLTTQADPARHLTTRVDIELELPQGFPVKYEAAVMRAVEQCTVKRHLQEPPEFGVRVARALPA